MTTARYAHTIIQFFKFGMVGGSGVIVNMAVAVAVAKIALWTGDIVPHDEFLNLLGTRFHIRWYHVFSTIAFVLANLWNFQLNRWWTFKTHGKGGWWKEFVSFFAVGLVSYFVSLGVMTLLMHPDSPLQLSPRVFDNSSGLRNQYYWANMISIIVAMPINFIVNKLWTFRSARR